MTDKMPPPAAPRVPPAPPPKRPPVQLTVGEVSRRSGIPVSTLHFYEAKGLIGADRSLGNQRRYSRDILRRLAIIQTARQFGISLADIAELLKPIPPGVQPSADDVKAMVAGWRAALQERIEGLTLLRDRLDGCIGCGCLSLEDCPLRNPSDELGENDSGAVLLRAGHKTPG